MGRSYEITDRTIASELNDILIGGKRVAGIAPTNGQVLRYNAAPNGEWEPSTISGGGPSVLNTAVVDIGPTTNNGPGDQAKGILDWSAHPILIVTAPGAGKIIAPISWSVQFVPGNSDYLEPFAQDVYGAWAFDLAGTQTGDVCFASVAVTGVTISTFDIVDSLISGSGVYVGGAVLPQGKGRENRAILFGDVNSAGELTTGDGSVRITIHYTIDDILV